MAHHLLNVSPTTIITTDLSDIFHIKSEHTVKNYVAYLKQAFLLIGIKKYSSNGWDLYYLSDRSGECDFIVCNGNTVLQAIQVSYDISSEKTYKRETNGLLLANRHTKCENLLLLTDHESKDIDKCGHHIAERTVYEWSTSI